MRHLLLALLFAASAVVPALAQSGTAEFIIIGRDADPSGIPVVAYSIEGDGPFAAVTNDEGIAVFTDLPDGTYAAYAAPEANVITVFAAQAATVVGGGTAFGASFVTDIDPTAGLVRGRLTDSNTDQPVRLSFLIASPEGPEQIRSAAGIAAVDGDGNYAFQVDPGTYDLRYSLIDLFSDTSFRPGMASVSVGAGQTVIADVALERRVPGILAGSVIDAETGAPIPGSPVEIYATDNSYAAVTISGPDGRYQVEIPENDYIVAITATGSGYLPQYYDGATFFSSATPVTVEGNATTSGIDFSLETIAPDFAVTVTGRLVDSDGQPIQSGTVEAFDLDEPFGLAAAVRAGTDGTFSLASDSPSLAGSYLALSFRAPGFVQEFYDDAPDLFLADFLATGGEAITFDLGDITLLAEGEDAEGLAISGAVRSATDGSAIAGAVVAVSRIDADDLHYAISDASGAFRVDGLESGEYVVAFTADGFVPEFYPNVTRWTEANRIVLNENVSNINGELGGLNRPVRASASRALGTVRGAILDPLGQPVRGAVVTARDGSGAALASTLTDAAGRYELQSVEGSALAVSVDRPRFLPADRVTTTSGPGVLNVTLGASVSTSSESEGPRASGDLAVFPNPTQGMVRAAFTLAEAGPVRVSVYDALGREVTVAAEGARSAGAHVVEIDERLAPGLYVLRVATPDGHRTRSFVVVR